MGSRLFMLIAQKGSCENQDKYNITGTGFPQRREQAILHYHNKHCVHSNRTLTDAIIIIV